ncbi:MAG: efflux RND transporter permease subunit, partial [Bacteroidota bacterium]
IGDSLLTNDRVDSLNLRAELSPLKRQTALYDLTLDLKQAAPYGITWGEWARSWQYFSDRPAPAFTLPIRLSSGIYRLPVVFKGESAAGIQLDQLDQANWLSQRGRPLSGQWMSARRYVPESEIHKENQRYLRRIDFIYRGSGIFARRHLDQVLASADRNLPPGYQLEEKEDSWFPRAKDEASPLQLLLIIGSLIFVVCACLFESLTRAWWVISILPLAFVGAFLAYHWSPVQVEAGTFAALSLLMGLTVNNAIFLIHHLNLAPKKDLLTLLSWTRMKLLPIMLTTLTTVIAMTPILVEKEPQPFWYNLSVGSIGGLLMSSVLLLVIIPLLMAKVKTDAE